MLVFMSSFLLLLLEEMTSHIILGVVSKVVNSVPFRLEWPKHSIPIQKTEQNGTNFISF